GTLPLSAPATGACKLIHPAAGTPTALGALEGERGAVEEESVHEISPTAETTAKKTGRRAGARINLCWISEAFSMRSLYGRTNSTRRFC
ncbi:MAG TPA: hypothetical protein VIM36_15610, partial [Gemmatimonadaceae bacterium]